MLRVHHVMTADPVQVSASATLADAVRLLREHGLSALPVCSATGAVLGVITDRILLMAWAAAPAEAPGTPVSSLVEVVPHTVEPGDPAAWALEVMAAFGVRRLPVTDDGRLVGMLTRSDLARRMPVADVGRLVLDQATV